jgi:TPR repeat protein
MRFTCSDQSTRFHGTERTNGCTTTSRQQARTVSFRGTPTSAVSANASYSRSSLLPSVEDRRCFYGRVDAAEQWYRRGDELADEGGSAEGEALALLRAAVAAGHGPARVRLAVFLLLQYSDADAASHAEAFSLLDRAVASDEPGARNMLGLALWENGAMDDAEDYLRAAVAEGDPDAPVNLARLLHLKGRDAEAFALLRQAAEGGDGVAYWIVMWLLPKDSRAAREVTNAYESATGPEERPVCVRFSADDWQLDASMLPVD